MLCRKLRRTLGGGEAVSQCYREVLGQSWTVLLISLGKVKCMTFKLKERSLSLVASDVRLCSQSARYPRMNCWPVEVCGDASGTLH